MTRPRQHPKPPRNVARNPCCSSDDSDRVPYEAFHPGSLSRSRCPAIREASCAGREVWAYLERAMTFRGGMATYGKEAAPGTHVMQLLKSPRMESPSLIARSSRQHFMTTSKHSMLWPKRCPKKTPFPARGPYRRETSQCDLVRSKHGGFRRAHLYKWRPETRHRTPPPPTDKKRQILLSPMRIIRSPPLRMPPQIMPGHRMPTWKASLPIAGIVI